MNWFRRQDDLNRGLLGMGVLCLLVAFVFGGNRTVTTIFRLLFALCVLWFLYRNFFASPQRREHENMVYLRAKTTVEEWFRSLKRNWRNATESGSAAFAQWKARWAERKQYRYLTCTQCGQKLRVPRGKGKIRVTCTKCRNQFLAKS